MKPLMQQGFDTIATEYDALFTRSLIGSAQRDRVRQYLGAVLPASRPLKVLDLGCGTGEDAIWFARSGHSVTAVDASAFMLEAAKKKIEAGEFGAAIQLRHFPIEQVRSAALDAPFDLVFSNFGAMNCLSPATFRRIVPDLRELLTPAGRLIMVLMPRSCAWEIIYYLLKRQPAEAFRRRSGPGVRVRVSGNDILTSYYAPSSVVGMFEEAFRPIAVRPVGFFVPPSYLEPFVAAHPRFYRLLGACDRAFSGVSMLAPFADHALVDLEVKR